MVDNIWTGIAGAFTTIAGFVIGQIEPLPGVLLAALGGALLSAMIGDDKPFGKLCGHILLGFALGVAASQIADGIWNIKPHVRVGVACLCGLFGEKAVFSIHKSLSDGTFWDGLAKLLPWGKK